MNPRVLRILIPLAVAGLATLVVLTMFMSRPPGKSSAANGTANSPAASPSGDAAAATQPSTAPATPTTAASTQPVAGLHVRLPLNAVGTPRPLGSLDPREALCRVSLNRLGAGISEIAFSNIWETAAARRQSDRYEKSRPADASLDPTKLDASERYVLQREQPYRWIAANGQVASSIVPVLAAHSITINGSIVNLLESDGQWVESAPGVFEAVVVNEQGEDMVRIVRQFTLGANYDIVLTQRIVNLTSQPLDIRWRQYGPMSLRKDRSGYIDNRRFNFGYLPEPARLPNLVLANNSDLTVELGSAQKRIASAQEPAATALTREQELTVWPNRKFKGNGSMLSWFASTNRYFGMAIHPVLDPQGRGSHALESNVQEIRMVASDGHAMTPEEPIFTFLTSPVFTVQPGSEHALDMGLFAGPLDRHILSEQPYESLAMHQLILYRLSSCCAFLSFQWLADGLLLFLSFLHNYVFFDWGLAIIALVCVVRALLHPITKKSQVHMQRLGKQMSALKPEIEKLQKKYPNDPKKVQQEQMRLMQEHGVNPLKMVGCLTIFIQTPIWIALWAMLYLAFDIRQQPAFYGIFQQFSGWPFLGDLSSPDSFIPLGSGVTIPLLGWHVASINLMPILMGVVFFIQQKYMTPPSATPLSPEQEQQQKIMKVMMVVMMPLFLYSAPSGLTLYMFTSSCIGILESKYVRAHISELELNPPKPNEKDDRKPKGAKARMWAGAMERARERARQKNAPPPRKFKDRE